MNYASSVWNSVSGLFQNELNSQDWWNVIIFEHDITVVFDVRVFILSTLDNSSMFIQMETK